MNHEPLNLFPTIFPRPISPRPKPGDASIALRAASLALPHVEEWFEAADESESFDASEVASTLREVFSDTSLDNGYSRANELEDRHFWEPDAELVRILDDVWIMEVEIECVEAWVKTHDVRPLLALGASISYQESGYRGAQRGPVYEATITGIDEKQARYTVCVPALGHVSLGDLGTQGFLVAFEAIEAQNQDKIQLPPEIEETHYVENAEIKTSTDSGL